MKLINKVDNGDFQGKGSYLWYNSVMEEDDPLLRYVKEMAGVFGSIALGIIIVTIIAAIINFVV